MFRKFHLAVAGIAMVIAAPAQAADYIAPQPVYVQPAPAVQPVNTSGWYLRGDLGFHGSQLRGTEYITYGCCTPEPGTGSFDTTRLKSAWSAGIGLGYEITQYLRTDLTLDHWSRSGFVGTSSGTCGGAPCFSTDESNYRAWVLLANLYADLGTYHGITPYVGAGIGGAHVRWDDLRDAGNPAHFQPGTSNWRFAWALMAGASYCLSDNLELDAGYRYTRIAGGRMFEVANQVGPGFDSGLNVHEVRAGLRWHLGGASARCAPAPAGYAPRMSWHR